MNCPGCGKTVADGTSICPSCDYIIDSSFLGDLEAPPAPRPSSPSRPSGAQAPARARPASRPSSAGAPRAAPRPAGSAPPKRPAPRPAPPPPEPEPEAEAPAEEEMDWRAAARAAGNRAMRQEDSGSSGMMEPEEAYAEAKQFVSGLPTSDKLALTGAGIVVLFSFFPWKETAADGEVLGLLSTGALALGSAVVCAVAVLGRVRRMMPRLGPLIPWIIQLVAVTICVVSCLTFIRSSIDSRKVQSPVGNYEVKVSQPSFGVFIGMLGGLVALGGTLMGLRDKAT